MTSSGSCRREMDNGGLVRVLEHRDLGSMELSAVFAGGRIKMLGNLTASGLHFERHHGGIPTIDPSQHMLFVHGMVGTAKKFSMADLKRFPSVTRKYFIECSGNGLTEWNKPTLKTVQGRMACSAPPNGRVQFATIAREVGLNEGSAWVLAEGADAAVMTRSIPLEKMLKDAILAYGQNGEAIRPEQGYRCG